MTSAHDLQLGGWISGPPLQIEPAVPTSRLRVHEMARPDLPASEIFHLEVHPD
jgi:hypothetical protein